jgi:hypothetical protein
MISSLKSANFFRIKPKLIKVAKLGIITFIVSILTLSSLPPAYSASLELTLSTNKQTYSLGEKVIVNGNLTLNQNPVPDGLVAVQVNDARGILRVLRTRPTGTNITKRWSAEILDLAPVGQFGPKYEFRRGSDIGFKVTIKNNDLISHDVNITICIYYPDEGPLRTASIWHGILGGNETKTVSSFPFATISNAAPLGTAVAYANILNSYLPKDGGFAYAPEKLIAFNITDNQGSSSTTSALTQSDSANGTFNLTFRTPRVAQGYLLGNCTVYATSFYLPYFASNRVSFEVIIRGDIDGDGKCDIKDIAIVSLAYGSFPGHPNWNPIADLYPDLKIDILDIAIVAKDYGKVGIPP